MTLAGIDISSYQGNFDWEAWEGKIQFAGVKITEGCYFADPFAAQNVAGAHRIGIPVLGYHFLHAGLPGAKQAEYFLSHAHQAGLQPGRDHIANDAEDAGRDGLDLSHLVSAADEFTNELRGHYARFPGWWPELYTEISLAPAFTGLGNCPLWLANPSGTPVTSIGPWKTVSFEQTGQRGVDVDKFYGDLSQLKALAIPHS